jgi:anti-anti-sigma factor
MLKEVNETVEECVVIRANSYLGGRTGEELEKEFEASLQSGKRHFVIDFRETEIINSIGISIIIGIIERITENMGSINFANLSKVNEEILGMMGLLRYAPLVREAG